MSVYKRGGVWWCEFQILGQRVRESTGVPAGESKRAAQKAEREIRTREEKRARRHRLRDYRLSEACDFWLRERGALLREGARPLRRALARTCALFDNDPLLREIDGAAVAEALTRRRALPVGAKQQRPVSEARVLRDSVANLRRVLNYMAKVHGAQLAEAPIAWGALTTATERATHAGRELAAHEEEAFWATRREDYAEFVEFLMLSSLRRGEALARWTDWDPARQALRVRRQKKKPGAKEEWRWVSIGARGAALIEAQRGRHAEWIWTYDARVWVRDAESGHRVQAPGGERRPITKEGLKSLWRRKHRQAAAPGFRVHDTRHHSLSALVRATGSIELARDRADHADVRTTSAFYAHVLDEDARRAADAIEATVRGPKAARTSESPHKSPHNATPRKRKSG
jgi:hypothetical protein